VPRLEKVRYSDELRLVSKVEDQVLSQRSDPTRSEPGLRRKAFVLGTVIALIALAVGSVFGDRGLLNLAEKRRQVESLRSEIETLRVENARLVGEVEDLRQSPRAIERLAREELGLARPDETVFLIREEDPPAPR
jgi:cell division protein FtsB